MSSYTKPALAMYRATNERENNCLLVCDVCRLDVAGYSGWEFTSVNRPDFDDTLSCECCGYRLDRSTDDERL